MSVAARAWTLGGCRLNEVFHQTLVMPLVMFSVTGRCNSRCVSCDWWRGRGDDDLTLAEVRDCVATLSRFGLRHVTFSGGEPLVRPDVFALADLFCSSGVSLELLTSGLALARFARDVADRFDAVTVSLDGATPASYQAIRGVDGFELVRAGVRAVKAQRPALLVTARVTLHQKNFRELPALVQAARWAGVDRVSFLAADLSSSAFGRHAGSDHRHLALQPGEVDELEDLIEETVRREAEAFRSGFIVEPPEKLRVLAAYYRAVLGERPFPAVGCNAPWVSLVLEANGDVRPCFFHDAVGNVRATPLETILRERLPSARARLDVSRDATCERCVCSLKLRWRLPW